MEERVFKLSPLLFLKRGLFFMESNRYKNYYFKEGFIKGIDIGIGLGIIIGILISVITVYFLVN